jgi:hypothetical protein
VLYASVTAAPPHAKALLDAATEVLLQSLSQGNSTRILWHLSYRQRASAEALRPKSAETAGDECALTFPNHQRGVAFDDSIIDGVRASWQKIMGAEADEAFLAFEDREAMEANQDDDI